MKSAVARLTTQAVARRSAAQLLTAAGRKNSALCIPTRTFAASAGVRLQQGLATELELEQKNYEKPEALQAVPSGWQFVEEIGDVNMKLTKTNGNKLYTVSWQLQAPFVDPEEMEQPDEDEAPSSDHDFTEFRVEIENTKSKAGMRLFCDTQNGESPRYFIRNIQCYQNAKEKENANAYSGPDYEDLEDKLQENLDGYLVEIGVNDELCEFVETLAVDKEHREYMRWLETATGIMA